MAILLTGFVPFSENRVNPSQWVVEALAGQAGLVTAVLPVEFQAAGDCLRDLIQQHAPEAILMLGLAEKRPSISLERFALNIDDARIADNAGKSPSGQPIADEGPAAYTTTLPLQAMLDSLQALDIPAMISNHAGTYVCNHVFYVARHRLAQSGRAIPCGFIHLPPIADSPDDPGLPLEMMLAAVRCCVDQLVALK